jgi:hypothetical protein
MALARRHLEAAENESPHRAARAMLETAVVKGSPGRASGVVLGALAVSPAIHGGAAQGVCFVDNMETVSDTPTRRRYTTR